MSTGRIARGGCNGNLASLWYIFIFFYGKGIFDANLRRGKYIFSGMPQSSRSNVAKIQMMQKVNVAKRLTPTKAEGRANHFLKQVEGREHHFLKKVEFFKASLGGIVPSHVYSCSNHT